jgi:hypothetical protein
MCLIHYLDLFGGMMIVTGLAYQLKVIVAVFSLYGENRCFLLFLLSLDLDLLGFA